MQDHPPFAGRGRRERGADENQPNHSGENRASLWLAAATVIIALAALSFSQDKIRNGGAPFVITPANPPALTQSGSAAVYSPPASHP